MVGLLMVPPSHPRRARSGGSGRMVVAGRARGLGPGFTFVGGGRVGGSSRARRRGGVRAARWSLRVRAGVYAVLSIADRIRRL